MVIRAIVYAKDEEEALDKAKEIFSDLVEQRYFDYFTTFDEDGCGISGRDRWGDLPVVAPADSEVGKKLIEEGMELTWQEFQESLHVIKKCTKEKTAEKLFEDMRFRYACYHIGAYKGADIWLYDDDGEGIQNRDHLNNVLTKWKVIYEDKGIENPYRDCNIWVVPADVHF